MATKEVKATAKVADENAQYIADLEKELKETVEKIERAIEFIGRSDYSNLKYPPTSVELRILDRHIYILDQLAGNLKLRIQLAKEKTEATKGAK